MDTSSRKQTAWIWLCVLTPLAAIGTAALLLGFGLVFNASGKGEMLSADERERLLDINHLAQWMDGYVPDTVGEQADKTRFVDDTYSLAYVYDHAGDARAPYLAYTLTYEHSEGDAIATYLSSWGGTRVGFWGGEGEMAVEESNEMFRWGDASRFAVLTTQSHPFGNVFVARDGNTVVYLLLAGVYFDERATIEALLLPYLERLERTR